MAEVTQTSRRMSLAEWAELDEDEPGELVDGELVEEEDVGVLHEALVAFLARIIGNWLAGRGRVLTSDARFAVSAKRGRKPDLTVYLTRAQLPARGIVTTPPDIAIEVVSPTPADRRRDRVQKLAEYAAFGARYYWLVDPELRTLEVLELGADGTYRIALATTEGTTAIPGCEGFAVDLDALWAEIADLDVR